MQFFQIDNFWELKNVNSWIKIEIFICLSSVLTEFFYQSGPINILVGTSGRLNFFDSVVFKNNRFSTVIVIYY